MRRYTVDTLKRALAVGTLLLGGAGMAREAAAKQDDGFDSHLSSLIKGNAAEIASAGPESELQLPTELAMLGAWSNVCTSAYVFDGDSYVSQAFTPNASLSYETNVSAWFVEELKKGADALIAFSTKNQFAAYTANYLEDGNVQCTMSFFTYTPEGKYGIQQITVTGPEGNKKVTHVPRYATESEVESILESSKATYFARGFDPSLRLKLEDLQSR